MESKIDNRHQSTDDRLQTKPTSLKLGIYNLYQTKRVEKAQKSLRDFWAFKVNGRPRVGRLKYQQSHFNDVAQCKFGRHHGGRPNFKIVDYFVLATTYFPHKEYHWYYDA